MVKVRRVCRVLIVVLAMLSLQAVSRVPGVHAEHLSPDRVRSFVENGRVIDETIISGIPPATRARISSVRDNVNDSGVRVLSNVPAFDWSYGCSATAAAMLFGYYDNVGYSSMYTGPENGGVCPMNNAVWGYGETPLSASHKGVDGRTVKGHVDDYWVKYGDKGNDPYVTGGWTEHAPLDCTADFMGTNQQKYGNGDGSTVFYFNGTPVYDRADSGGIRDGCHGMRLYAESRGYTVETNYSQYIAENTTGGFTFEQFQSEINAGRPVLIQVTNHTMLGYGYDASAHTIEVHDTWDHASHTMQWGGSYPYGDTSLQHFGVTVIHLAVPGYSLSSSVSSGSGTISRSPDQLSYSAGTPVTLTANAASGYSFTGWSGDATGTANPITVTMNGNKTVTASFAAIDYGEPKSTHTWLDFPAGTSNVLAYDIDVCIDAFPSAPDPAWLYYFAIQTDFSDGGGGAHGGLQWASGGKKANWGGYDLRYAGDTQSIVVDQPWATGVWYRYHAARGTQQLDGTWAWGFWITDLGTGTSRSLGDIYSKGSSISGCAVWMEAGYGVVATTARAQVRWHNPAYVYGALKTIAHPVAGYATYNGTCIEPHITDQQLVSRNPREWIQTTNASVRTTPADTFLWKDTTFTVASSSSPSPGGTISRSPDQLSYPSGTVVTLTATPARGFSFTGWSGDVSGTVNPVTVTMDGDKIVTAAFTEGPVSSLITHYYTSLLDRSPEESGRLFWLDEITRTQSLGIDTREGFIALARFFLTSPEYQARNTTNAVYVTDLYETFFNRTPAPSEVTYWTDLMTAGMSRDITMNWFVYSSEYATYMTSILGSSVTRPENNLVNDLYRGFLNRLPDTGGFTTQLTAMRTAQASDAAAVRSTTRAIALNFVNSPEYALRARTDAQFIEDCYNGILRRGALASEIQGWVDLLTRGASRTEVLTGFVDSPEFQLRVNEVIAAGPYVP